MPDWLFILTLICAIGCGVIGGVFFAFSTFVMKALRRLPPREGMAAMNAINVAVINPLFLGVFLGTTVLCGALVVLALLRWAAPGAALLPGGGLLYLVGTFGVTMLRSVPLNNALAGVAPDADDAATRWGDYARRWTAWNHVRTVAAIVAAAMLVVASGGFGLS